LPPDYSGGLVGCLNAIRENPTTGEEKMSQQVFAAVMGLGGIAIMATLGYLEFGRDLDERLDK